MKRYRSASDCARAWGVSRQRVHQWLVAGRIEGARLVWLEGEDCPGVMRILDNGRFDKVRLRTPRATERVRFWIIPAESSRPIKRKPSRRSR